MCTKRRDILLISKAHIRLTKPENVLLHDPGPFPRVTIADFGLARQKAYQATFNAVGTVSYMPPEAIHALAIPNAKYVGMPADCWSLGCCKCNLCVE